MSTGPGSRCPISRSSRAGREQTKARNLEDEMVPRPIQRFKNRRKREGTLLIPEFDTFNRTTLENARVQPPSPASPMVKTSTQPMNSERVWRPGELAGSGKASFHASTSARWNNRIRRKRCFRVHETHDLETRQHRSRVFRSSHRRSTIKSVISGGRCGFGMASMTVPGKMKNV